MPIHKKLFTKPCAKFLEDSARTPLLKLPIAPDSYMSRLQKSWKQKNVLISRLTAHLIGWLDNSGGLAQSPNSNREGQFRSTTPCRDTHELNVTCARKFPKLCEIVRPANMRFRVSLPVKQFSKSHEIARRAVSPCLWSTRKGEKVRCCHAGNLAKGHPYRGLLMGDVHGNPALVSNKMPTKDLATEQDFLIRAWFQVDSYQ